MLLVDASQGIQAQTLSVYQVASSLRLTILPVINKVDLPHASPEEVSQEIEDSFGISKERHLKISAKSGLGVETVLEAVVNMLPAPGGWREKMISDTKEGEDEIAVSEAKDVVAGDDSRLRGLVIDT